MTYTGYLQLLFRQGDKAYAAFSQPLANSSLTVIGVRIPILRQLIKTHCTDTDLRLSDLELGKYLEVDFSYFALGLLRCKNTAEQLNFLSANLSYAQSWIITDMLNSYLKKATFEDFWSFFLAHHCDEHVYTRRFAYVFGLKFYRDQRILQVLPYLKSDTTYMVYMGQAWLLATVAIAYPDAVYNFLVTASAELKAKTISKIRDSFRINEKIKARLVALRNQNK